MFKSVMVCAVVLAMVTVSQGALIASDTVDPMHDESLWDASNISSDGFFIFSDRTGQLGALDPFDTESPAIGLQRYPADAATFDYQAAPGKQFSTVDVCLAVLMGSDNGSGLSYKDGNGNYIPMTTPTVTSLGTASNWDVYRVSYDLSSLNTDRFRVTVASSAYYTPIISSVSMTVVPEPATLGMLAMSGMMMLRRRK